MISNKVNSVQEWLPVDEILENGIIKVKNKNYIKILKIIPINFELKSNLEKEAILNSYKIFLKTCNFDIQILIQSNKKDLSNHISKIKEKNKEEKKHNENIQEIEKAEQDIKEFLDNFLTKETKYEVKINNFDIYVDMNGENLNYLIGYRGETINAIQTILTAIANKKSTQKIRVYLDIAGYREKRIKTLEDLAEKLARTVERTKKSVTLEPMTAYERKIIHTKLQNNSKVKTFSKGEEPYRKVVISLK